MNKLDTSSPALIYSENIPTHVGYGTIQRFIVLVPADSDYTSAARRIADLANASRAHVLFLGLCKDGTQEFSLRRELITLSALLQDGSLSAEVKVEVGIDWVNFVKSNYRVGDGIVCLAEQRTGLLQRPLSQILQSNIDAPIYILSDSSSQSQPRSNWFSQIMVWSGSVGIIVGVLFIQIRLTSLPQDWVHTTLLILSVIGETWLIWGWNSLFS